eukprot:10057395-Lingulodinium_polyedra.AAC.1
MIDECTVEQPIPATNPTPYFRHIMARDMKRKQMADEQEEKAIQDAVAAAGTASSSTMDTPKKKIKAKKLWELETKQWVKTQCNSNKDIFERLAARCEDFKQLLTDLQTPQAEEDEASFIQQKNDMIAVIEASHGTAKASLSEIVSTVTKMGQGDVPDEETKMHIQNSVKAEFSRFKTGNTLKEMRDAIAEATKFVRGVDKQLQAGVHNAGGGGGGGGGGSDEAAVHVGGLTLKMVKESLGGEFMKGCKLFNALEDATP